MGCDLQPSRPRTCLTNFNPRTHVGCDAASLSCRPTGRYFNPRTHVGCDLRYHFVHAAPNHFNPRTHVGCDDCTGAIARSTAIFQSTHPRGVRQTLQFQRQPFHQFQSTHPRGVRRTNKYWVVRIVNISIHAPTWGATSWHSFH